MEDLRITLVSDGSSDRVLNLVIKWLLRNLGVELAIIDQWADLRHLRDRANGLEDRLAKAIDLFPCDLLFIHRDAEREPREVRVQEIELAVNQLDIDPPPTVFVIPVRMQEAWLLINELAIRRASGNPNGRNHLNMPRLNQIEGIADPKAELYQLIRHASGATGRKRKKLNARIGKIAYRVGELIEDFGQLRALPAFRGFEAQLVEVLNDRGWL